jgi:hypothetical protein
MSLELFSAEEHQRLVDAESKYGNAFVNAYNTTTLLSNLMMWPVVDCDLFIRFYSQMKKYHTLSVISTVRLHRVQAKMNLRYFLESTANGAFSLAHSDTRNYFDLQNNRAGGAQKATTKAYKWLEATYSAHSNFMRKLKADINEQTAHAHVINSQHNFDFVPGQRAEIITSYFDFEDDELCEARSLGGRQSRTSCHRSDPNGAKGFRWISPVKRHGRPSSAHDGQRRRVAGTSKWKSITTSADAKSDRVDHILVDDELAVQDPIAQRYEAAYPNALLLRGGDLVADALADDLPFELGEGEQHVEGQSPHAGRRIEGLGDGDERDAMGVEWLDQLGEVGQRAGQAV